MEGDGRRERLGERKHRVGNVCRLLAENPHAFDTLWSWQLDGDTVARFNRVFPEVPRRVGVNWNDFVAPESKGDKFTCPRSPALAVRQLEAIRQQRRRPKKRHAGKEQASWDLPVTQHAAQEPRRQSQESEGKRGTGE
ncbi:hypothetical protein DPEC_G00185810 [Dallia pectoralis]|uniref:Uncharacterized protein n=1 Tax=Dallia pectoralis TaxID=75939 RepID=A0ACC2GBD6_DALPE|nr:hypothetical protein DPEC_G00185810 [Dallia pectoralis]